MGPVGQRRVFMDDTWHRVEELEMVSVAAGQNKTAVVLNFLYLLSLHTSGHPAGLITKKLFLQGQNI